MICSDEEAKTKICHIYPAAMKPLTGIAAPDGSNVQLLFAPCLGSQCMQWRWWTDASGYCGMAGPPTHAEPNHD